MGVKGYFRGLPGIGSGREMYSPLCTSNFALCPSPLTWVPHPLGWDEIQKWRWVPWPLVGHALKAMVDLTQSPQRLRSFLCSSGFICGSALHFF
jgi:hypothetical protein